MNPITQKVLERLNLEKALLTTGLKPKRNRITLEEAIEAGREEPRVYTVLPGILLYKPSILHRLSRDLKKFPAEAEFVQNLFRDQLRLKNFYGAEIQDCRRAALTFKAYLDQKKSRQKSLTMTFRLSPEDIARLQQLTEKLQTGGLSETIRYLAREKSRHLPP